jgi:hypothetical protein
MYFKFTAPHNTIGFDTLMSCWVQGDQIGEIFAYIVPLFTLGSFGKITKEANFGLFFPRKKVMYLLRQKNVWATIWAFIHKLIWSPMLGRSSL